MADGGNHRIQRWRVGATAGETLIAQTSSRFDGRGSPSGLLDVLCTTDQELFVMDDGPPTLKRINCPLRPLKRAFTWHRAKSSKSDLTGCSPGATGW